MAPTQPFRARTRKTSDPHVDAAGKHGESQRRKHRSEVVPSQSRGEHNKAKRERRYDVVKKLDVCVDGASGSDEEYGSDLDLEKPLHSIGEYLHQRTVAVRNMFSSLKKDTLNKMVPAVLRDFSTKELEEKCVFELDGMSKKRVRAILSGQNLPSDSGTDESEDEAVPASNVGSQKRTVHGQSPVESLADSASDSTGSADDAESLSGMPAPRNVNGNLDTNEPACLTAVDQTEVELVELELRAQALRVMMQQLEEEDGSAKSHLSCDPDMDIDILLDEAMEDGECDDDERPAQLNSAVKRGEGDFFEIHVNEDELADFR